MTSKVTFLHTGDIHLGAPIRGLQALDEHWAARLRTAIAESYERIIRNAIARKVDFAVFAGDSFDTSRASYGDFILFFEGLQKLADAGIPSYIVTGNHDPYTSWAKDTDRLPEMAHLIGVNGPTFELFERDGEPLCLIGGRSYFNQTWPIDKDIAEGISRTAAEQALLPEHPLAAEAPFSIGIIHTGLDLDEKKAPTNEADLMSRGIDYWACGHLHKRLVRPGAHDPRIVFPGSIQGRTIREQGEHGCYVVTLEADAPVPEASMLGADDLIRSHVRTSIEFMPAASVVMAELHIDVGDQRTLADMGRHIQAELFRVNGKAHCEDMVVRITLTGKTELFEFLSQPEVLERVRKRLNDAYPSFYCDALVNRTLPVEDFRTQYHEGLFPSVVMSMADEQRARADEMINYAQSEFVKRGVSVPESLSRRIDEFEDAAELFILRLLEQEDER